MKVDKQQFDTLLHKMMQAPHEPKKTIEGKAGKMVRLPASGSGTATESIAP